METSAKTHGQIAFEAYGNLPGPFGAWKTFDGREMPQWDAINELTRARWEAGVKAVLDTLSPKDSK